MSASKWTLRKEKDQEPFTFALLPVPCALTPTYSDMAWVIQLCYFPFLLISSTIL